MSSIFLRAFSSPACLQYPAQISSLSGLLNAPEHPVVLLSHPHMPRLDHFPQMSLCRIWLFTLLRTHSSVHSQSLAPPGTWEVVKDMSWLSEVHQHKVTWVQAACCGIKGSICEFWGGELCGNSYLTGQKYLRAKLPNLLMILLLFSLFPSDLQWL